MHWGRGRSHVSSAVKKTPHGNEHCLSGELKGAWNGQGVNSKREKLWKMWPGKYKQVPQRKVM